MGKGRKDAGCLPPLLCFRNQADKAILLRYLIERKLAVQQHSLTMKICYENLVFLKFASFYCYTCLDVHVKKLNCSSNTLCSNTYVCTSKLFEYAYDCLAL